MYWNKVQSHRATSSQNWLAEKRSRITTEPPPINVAPVANAALDRAVLARNGTIAIYANDGSDLSIEVRPSMMLNARYQFVMVYTVPAEAKQRAVEDVAAAVNAHVLRVGEDAGMPLHRQQRGAVRDPP